MNRTQRWTGRTPWLILVLTSLFVMSGCNLSTGSKLAVPAAAKSTATKTKAAVATTRQQRSAAIAQSLRVMNYYPADHSWQQMWTSWSASGFDHDMTKIAATGANAVRLIVFPSVFGFPTPDPTMASRLHDAITIAGQHGLQIQLTLFDYWGDYRNLVGARSWSTALLSPYRDDPRVALVEVRNEVNPGDAQAMAWAKDQIALVHTLLPLTPVTISTSGSQGVAGLTALKAALATAEPDVFELHYYGLSQLAFATFQQAKATVGSAPLLIGEAGMSTYLAGSTLMSTDLAEAAQADWYRVVDGAAKAAGLAPVAPWTLYDFVPAGAPSGFAAPQYAYGLYHVDGTPKRAAAVVTAAFRGTLPTGATNGNFADVLDGVEPASWVAWMPTGVLSVGLGAGVSGDNALTLRRTTRQAGGVTSWYAIPTQAVLASQTWHVSVQARGTSATGLSDLTLGWFDRAGNWLGNASSSALPAGTTTWRTLTVATRPPAGAVAVRVYLRSSGNSGTAFFSRAAWSVTA